MVNDGHCCRPTPFKCEVVAEPSQPEVVDWRSRVSRHACPQSMSNSVTKTGVRQTSSPAGNSHFNALHFDSPCISGDIKCALKHEII